MHACKRLHATAMPVQAGLHARLRPHILILIVVCTIVLVSSTFAFLVVKYACPASSQRSIATLGYGTGTYLEALNDQLTW